MKSKAIAFAACGKSTRMNDSELIRLQEGISRFSVEEREFVQISNAVSKIYINGIGAVTWTLFDEKMKMRAYGDNNQVEVGLLQEGAYKLLITYENGTQKVVNLRKRISS